MNIWNDEELKFIEEYSSEIEAWGNGDQSQLLNINTGLLNSSYKKILLVLEYLTNPDKPFVIKLQALSLVLTSPKGVYLEASRWDPYVDKEGSYPGFYKKVLYYLLIYKYKLPKEFAEKIPMVIEGDPEQKIYRKG